MAGVLDDLVFLVGAWMLGDLFFLIVDRDPLIIGLEGQHAGGIGKGDTVAIRFKLDQRLGGAFDSQGETGIVIGFREGDQEGLLLFDKEVHRSFTGRAMDSAIGHLVPPKERLMIQVGQGGEGSS